MAMYRCGSNSGGGVTPTSITPSNATPAAMSSGVIYETTAAGYAIESYDSKTPDDTTPPTVASGDIVKMGGAGYLYATQQAAGSWEEVEAVSQAAGGSATFTIGQSLTVGNLYHIFTTNGANTLANATTGAEITVSSGASNLTKIEEISGYFNSSAYYSVIEHYTFVATSATVVFNKVATAKRLGYILYDTQGSGGGGGTQEFDSYYEVTKFLNPYASGTTTYTIPNDIDFVMVSMVYVTSVNNNYDMSGVNIGFLKQINDTVHFTKMMNKGTIATVDDAITWTNKTTLTMTRSNTTGSVLIYCCKRITS